MSRYLRYLRLAITLGLLIFFAALPHRVKAAGQLEDGLRALDDEQFATAFQRLAPLAKQGEAAAQAGLGVLFLNGWGVRQDYDEALKWLRQAATKGDGKALFSLGIMAVNGLGIPQDEIQAYAWFDCADRQGERNGAIGRDSLATHMAPEAVELARHQSQACVVSPLASAPGSSFREAPGFPEMVVIPAGGIRIGSSAADAKRDEIAEEDAPREGPQHHVTIAQAFALGRTPATFAEWDSCVLDGGCGGYRPVDLGWGRGDRPVVNVSWEDAQAYVAWLNRKVSGRESGPYRLPSEAEWEYAARAGSSTARWWGDDIGSGRANCDGCGSRWDGKQSAPVGSFPPNPFRLFDMLGNVWQWTDDCWNENYEGAPEDGRSWQTGQCQARVIRGHSYASSVSFVRSASRSRDNTGSRYLLTGFRVARRLD